MSKLANKALANAEKIIATAGVEVNFNGFIEDAKSRTYCKKFLWRNASHIASLVINSSANAFQTETLEDLAANGFDSMAEAVQCYIESNLDTWSQSDWVAIPELTDLDAQTKRLSLMVERWNEYHKNK